MAKINEEKAEGKLGILVVGVGGAVASTFIAGTLMARKGLGVPVGSITQLSTIKLSDGSTPKIKDVLPIAKLDDIVFGGWDIFEDNVYQAATHAAVLTQ